MPRIKCASVECKWNNDSSMCTYKGTLLLADTYMNTVNEGYQHFHRCKMYEKSEHAIDLENQFLRFMEERGLSNAT